jgi:crotonobetainyl-CoA:carnitine CoA-transferase CaiB-like acyl-CoA transferase
LRSPPPEIGAQNVEILREIGYDDEMIKHFLSRRGAHAASSDRLDTP